MIVVFGLATCAHVFQAFRYRKPYCSIMIISGLLQTFAYIFRSLSIQNPASLALYAAWFVLILVCIKLSLFYEVALLNLQDCTNLYQRVRVYDSRPYGLELHKDRQAPPIKRMEDWATFCRIGYRVSH